jgi:hypothetical protein
MILRRAVRALTSKCLCPAHRHAHPFTFGHFSIWNIVIRPEDIWQVVAAFDVGIAEVRVH